MSFSVCLIVGRRTLITHAPILGDGYNATALAFVDKMLTETDATFLMVDRRSKVGGHWNDAYPFVRLHQPSGFYGVASRPLGRHRLDETGFNNGFFELATGVEVLNYFHSLMDEVFIPSKRVRFKWGLLHYPKSKKICTGGRVLAACW
ncbi:MULTISPECIES: hypothetical protein [Gammaproteobacteria]|jgi:hypothetical protein|uniref:hypothetical protein n=1 Tax=Gammaproteobacteria TaxID=1236 RepID=UPI0006C83236|nr:MULTISPECIES: hypothetical protein [Gammaproteobacteria]KPD21073.1 hypothetical protein ADS78_08475 [Idiomarina abyssalis]